VKFVVRTTVVIARWKKRLAEFARGKKANQTPTFCVRIGTNGSGWTGNVAMTHDTYLPWLFMEPIPQRMIVRAPVPRDTVTWKPHGIEPERVTVSSFDLKEGDTIMVFDLESGFRHRYTIRLQQPPWA